MKPSPPLTLLSRRPGSVRRLLISDIDGTLISESTDKPGLNELRQALENRGDDFVFAVATGRSLDKTRQILTEHRMPPPDILVTSVGASIHYGLDPAQADPEWHRHIQLNWDRERVLRKLDSLPGLTLQDECDQETFKISFHTDPRVFRMEALHQALGSCTSSLSLIHSRQRFLDILPERASKGKAIQYLGTRWSIPASQIIACGDSGNDRDMFTGPNLGVVVGNHASELEDLRNLPRVLFAQCHSSQGVLEGLEHFGWISGASE